MKVTPKASRNAVQGWLGAALKVAVTAAPERGRANEAVIALLAETLGIARSKLRVTAGHAASRKIVEIEGIGIAELRLRLEAPSKLGSPLPLREGVRGRGKPGGE